jgi:hypothetical protein
MKSTSNPEKILRELSYDFRTFTINGFISFISEMKGREIIAIQWRMPPTIFGAWISDSDEPREYIFYRDNVPLIHQVHIQLHELSHFLLGHPTLQINRNTITDVLERIAPFPFTDSPRLRSPEKTNIEIQAETLATLIQQRVIQNASLNGLMNDLSSDAKLANFLKTMGLS